MAHFQRPHHQRSEQLLKSLNPEILEKAQCFFAGGTAISLQLNEYPESVDINFLCASIEGYRLLRNIGVYDQNLGELFTTLYHAYNLYERSATRPVWYSERLGCRRGAHQI